MIALKIFGIVLSWVGGLSGLVIVFSFLDKNPPAVWPLFIFSSLIGVVFLMIGSEDDNKSELVVHWASIFLLFLASVSAVIIFLDLTHGINPKGKITSNWVMFFFGSILGGFGQFVLNDS